MAGSIEHQLEVFYGVPRFYVCVLSLLNFYSLGVQSRMAPKKVEEPEAKPIFGRVGTNLKVGIVGIPNVGKSTFFNVLTKSQAAAENFPFCTIDPNESRVPVPDPRFEYLCEYYKPASKVPAFLNVVDIAGLVKGAAEGQGLGNAFLSHIRACDAIFHLCRAFEAEDVTHIEGEVDPIRDLEIIIEELRKKDEEYLVSSLEKLERTVCRGGDKKQKPEYDLLCKVKTHLVDEKQQIRFGEWNANEIEALNKHTFLTTKPAMYLVNLSEKDYIRKKNKWLVKIKEWVDKNDPGASIIPFSGVFENKFIDMVPAERAKFLEDNNCTSALDKIVVQGYKALRLHYFFTAGPDEVKAWTIQKGTKAPQAAGKIHTDFEKGFVMAEVMKFSDFKEEGSEAACKGAGKYRQQGRNYVVEDGDIIFFKFNTGGFKKKN
ncbi:obg-like ATPase 1 [Lycorma delicatula]|uniref:obg-like ATPase 1 n=1 Tax=Lycorma delicatula TaxID=130591 RepID=UPI003F511C29